MRLLKMSDLSIPHKEGDNLLDIFLFILVGYFDVSPIRLEINGDGLSKPLIFG